MLVSLIREEDSSLVRSLDLMLDEGQHRYDRQNAEKMSRIP